MLVRHRLFLSSSGFVDATGGKKRNKCGRGKEHAQSTTGGKQTQRSFNRVKCWKADSSLLRRRGTEERTEQEVLYANRRLHKPPPSSQSRPGMTSAPAQPDGNPRPPSPRPPLDLAAKKQVGDPRPSSFSFESAHLNRERVAK